jgi:hypothetical protein
VRKQTRVQSAAPQGSGPDYQLAPWGPRQPLGAPGGSLDLLVPVVDLHRVVEAVEQRRLERTALALITCIWSAVIQGT